MAIAGSSVRKHCVWGPEKMENLIGGPVTFCPWPTNENLVYINNLKHPINHYFLINHFFQSIHEISYILLWYMDTYFMISYSFCKGFHIWVYSIYKAVPTMEPIKYWYSIVYLKVAPVMKSMKYHYIL